MIFSLQSLGAVFAAQLFQITIVIMLAAIVIRLFCRRRPHLAYLLCMLALLKCLTPPLISSPAGVFSWVQGVALSAESTNEEPDEAAAPETPISNTSLADDFQNQSDPVANTIVETSIRPEPPKVSLAATASSHACKPIALAMAPMSIDWRLGFTVIWLFGAAVMAMLLLLRLVVARRMILSCTPCEHERLNRLLEKSAAQLGVKQPVRILLSDAEKGSSFGPAVFGWRCASVILPASFVAKSDAELAPMLFHELAHFRRGDTLAVWMQIIVKSVWWFHPLVWWLSAETSRHREICCDEEALASSGGDRARYAQGLLDILKERTRCRPTFALNGMKPIEVTKQRLIHIMNENITFRTRTPYRSWVIAGLLAAILLPGAAWLSPVKPTLLSGEPSDMKSPKVHESTMASWTQFLGGSNRNNLSLATNLPIKIDVKKGENVRWSFKTSTLSSPVIHDGKIFLGTNNSIARVDRFPKGVDIACMRCFDQKTGAFIWQYSSPRLKTGRVHDWPTFGICSVPFIQGDRMWFVTNRCEVVCLDTQGFLDGENDGKFKDEDSEEKNEADVIWKFDMMKELKVSPHNVSLCSPTAVGDMILVNTGAGVTSDHVKLGSPEAPSFLALNRKTGKVVWTSDLPSKNVMHGQWSSPSYGIIDGVPQAIFAGGDGWLYSFDVRDMRTGETNLLWKFDCNAKTSVWRLGGAGTRNNIIAAPVIHGDRVYITVGQDPEHGEGSGRLLCIDATRRGDISAELVYNKADPKKVIPHKRYLACDTSKGDFALPNKNSGQIWVYDQFDANGNGKIEFEEAMHRAISSTTISENRIYVADGSGLVHCINIKSGKPFWTYDLFAHASGTPLVADGKVYVGDEDGDIAIFRDAEKLELLGESYFDSSLYGTLVATEQTLYIASSHKLFAIGKPK